MNIIERQLDRWNKSTLSDSFIPNARALEPVFKARMFAEVQG